MFSVVDSNWDQNLSRRVSSRRLISNEIDVNQNKHVNSSIGIGEFGFDVVCLHVTFRIVGFAKNFGAGISAFRWYRFIWTLLFISWHLCVRMCVSIVAEYVLVRVYCVVRAIDARVRVRLACVYRVNDDNMSRWVEYSRTWTDTRFTRRHNKRCANVSNWHKPNAIDSTLKFSSFASARQQRRWRWHCTWHSMCVLSIEAWLVVVVCL